MSEAETTHSYIEKMRGLSAWTGVQFVQNATTSNMNLVQDGKHVLTTVYW